MFTKEDTQALKGCAILMMMFLHMFQSDGLGGGGIIRYSY